MPPTLQEHVLNDLRKKTLAAAAQVKKLDDALRKVEHDFEYVWQISISSAWASVGEESLPTKTYRHDSLREAIRAAATDFCIIAKRQYPGRVYTIAEETRTARSWDVQGHWYVGFLADDVYVSLPEDTWRGYVDELKVDTDENWDPSVLRATKASELAPEVP